MQQTITSWMKKLSSRTSFLVTMLTIVDLFGCGSQPCIYHAPEYRHGHFLSVVVVILFNEIMKYPQPAHLKIFSL